MTKKRKEKKTIREENPELPKHLKRRDTKRRKSGVAVIQLRVSTLKKVRSLVFRKFNRVEEACAYVKELTRGYKIKDRSKDRTYHSLTYGGSVCSFTNGIVVRSNYPMKLILKKVSPKALLPDISIASEGGSVSKKSPDTKSVEVKKTASSKKRLRSNGELISLKEVCRKHLDGMDPRKARQKLRAAAKADKMPHDWKGRWEFTDDQIDHVVKLLSS